MTLDFRETKRRYGRKKIREIDVVRPRPRISGGDIVAVMRPELDEFVPRAFTRFTLEEVELIAKRMREARHG